MSRRKAPATEDMPHPLPQSGGSFTVSAGQLVLEEYVQSVTPSPEKTPDESAVKPASKEA